MSDIAKVRVNGLEYDIKDSGGRALIDAEAAARAADVADLKDDLENLDPGLSDDAKVALLNCFRHVAWIDEHGQTYYDALEAALYESPYPRITATINQTGYVFDTDNIDSVKQYLTVKYFETEEDVGTVITNYTVSGVLTVGTSTVAIRYEGLSTTVNVTVSSYFFAPTFVIGGPSANNTSIGYGFSIARACNNPMAIKLPVGLYEIDNTGAGADYYYSVSAYSYNDAQYDVDWSFTEGTSKTIIEQSSVPYTIKWSLYVDGSNGWQNANKKQIRVTDQDTVVAINIKKYSAGTENITQNDLAALNNGGIVLRRISA